MKPLHLLQPLLLCTLFVCLNSNPTGITPRPIKDKMPQREPLKHSEAGTLTLRFMPVEIDLRTSQVVVNNENKITPEKIEPTQTQPHQIIANNDPSEIAPVKIAPKPLVVQKINPQDKFVPTAQRVVRHVDRKPFRPKPISLTAMVNRIMKNSEIQSHLSSIGDSDQRAYCQTKMRARLFEHMQHARPGKNRHRHLAQSTMRRPKTNDYSSTPHLAEQVDYLMQNKQLQASLKNISDQDEREYTEALVRLDFFDALSASKETGKARRYSRRRMTI